jgi:hypothetical protein
VLKIPHDVDEKALDGLKLDLGKGPIVGSVKLDSANYVLHNAHDDACSKVVPFVRGPDGKTITCPVRVRRMVELIRYEGEQEDAAQRARLLKQMTVKRAQEEPVRKSPYQPTLLPGSGVLAVDVIVDVGKANRGDSKQVQQQQQQQKQQHQQSGNDDGDDVASAKKSKRVKDEDDKKESKKESSKKKKKKKKVKEEKSPESSKKRSKHK